MNQPLPGTSINQTIQEIQIFDHQRIDVVSESDTVILYILSQTETPPPLPYIQAEMEEYIIVLFDRLLNLVTERITAYYPVAYIEKWDSLTTSAVSVLQCLNYLSLESVASSSHGKKHLEANLASIATNLESMDTKEKGDG